MFTPGLYLMLPCPPASISMALTYFFEQADLGEMVFTGGDDGGNPPQMTLVATAGYTLAAIAIQAERFRWARAVRAAA